MLRTVIAFIIVFSVIVIFHEFGHYYFAKRAGILVREFAIGMGPKVFQVRKGETVYTLRLLPVGGYVRMAGAEEDDEEIKPGMMVMIAQDQDGIVNCISFDEEKVIEQGVPFQVEEADLTHKMTLTGYIAQSEQRVTVSVSKTATLIEPDGTEVVVAPIERQFQSASLANRMLTNVAGPMNNFILAIVTFIVVAFLSGGVPSTEPVIGSFTDNSAAQEAGLEIGDRIESIEGSVIHNWHDIGKIIETRPDEATTIVVLRHGAEVTVTATPHAVATTNGQQAGVLGITTQKKTDLLSKILYGFTQTGYVIATVFITIASFFTRGFSLNDLGGPVAIYSVTSQVAQNGVIAILAFLGLLSANLGAMNLLPIPALDGGKLVLNIIEAIRKKPLDPEKESYITIAGAIFLIALMILVTWNDIMRLF